MNADTLAHATKRGEVQLIRKTSLRVAHIQVLFPIGKLTFSFDNETQVKHWHIQHPKRSCYLRRSRPGLTEGQTFKSLSLNNLHPCVNTFTHLACWGELSEQHTGGLGNCGTSKMRRKYNDWYLHPEPSPLKDNKKPLGNLQANQLRKYDQHQNSFLHVATFHISSKDDVTITGQI